MPPPREKSAATTPADAKASPPAPTRPDQKRDQIGSVKAYGGGRIPQLVIDATTPESFSGMMAAFGTKDRDFFDGLIHQIVHVASPNNTAEAINFLFSVVKNTQPRDELEAMLLAQMAACHSIAMEMTARLNHWEEYRLFPKIMKTFADLKETFDRGRRAGDQSFMVQNMTVKDGGQAIVGNVTQRSTEPNEGKTAASAPALADTRAVPLGRVNESPELAPCSPAAEQGEETHALGDKDDH